MNPALDFEGLATFAESANAIDVFLSMASRMPPYTFIRQMIVYHQGDILQAIENHAWKFSQFESLNKNFPVFKLGNHKGNEDEHVEGVIVVLPGSQEHISRIITISTSDFWTRIVRKLSRLLYPDAMPVFFKQQEIEESLLALEAVLPENYYIQLSDVTSKEERVKFSTSRTREYDTHRLWTDSPWRNVFMQAKEEKQWFTGIKFSIQRENKSGSKSIIASGRLSKHGELQYDYYHEKFSNSLLTFLEQRTSERLLLLQDRGIRERNYHPSKPIEIVFDYDAFDSIEDIREFGKIMAAYPRSGKAVYHGNPYYHASIADFVDGSSFDVWALSKDKVIIIPQAKSSAQAFERLITYVFTEFNEGTVNVYEESEEVE